MKKTHRAILTFSIVTILTHLSGQSLATKNREPASTQTLSEFVGTMNFMNPAQEAPAGPIAFSGTPFLDVALAPPKPPENSTSAIILPEATATRGGYLKLFILIAISLVGTLAYRYRHWLQVGNLAALPSFARQAFQKPAAVPAEPLPEQPFVLGEADYQSFQLLLEKIQFARGQADLNALSRHVTGMLLQNMTNELTENTNRGLVYKNNYLRMTEAELIAATQSETENRAEIFLKWYAVDYMARLDRQSGVSDYVASGNSIRPIEIQEIWTFTRARPNGLWEVSARQPVIAAPVRQQQVA